MLESSADEEFYDAIGDQAQIEQIKERISQTTDIQFSPDSPDPKKDFYAYFDRRAERKRTLRLTSSEEQEYTLTITERELKDMKEHSSKNLLQILDKLDETSSYISSEVPDSGGLKTKERSRSKESEIDSPNWDTKLSIIPSRLHIIHPFASQLKESKTEESADQTAPMTPQSSRSTGNSKGSPSNPVRGSAKVKKSFFSKKQSVDAEFTRENVRQHNKNTSNFDKLICLQNVNEDLKAEGNQSSKKPKSTGPTWVAKFSPNNKLLATGGSDSMLRIFRVKIMDEIDLQNESSESDLQILDPDCLVLQGHKFDIIDISWYKDSNLVLTSAIDKMVILWDVERKAVVKIFEHSDIVPCISFHSLVDEFFTSGCFDKMIRIWDINEAKVVDWVQTSDIITALTFSPDKNSLLVGFYKGTIKIYRTDQGKLKFAMEIACKNNFVWGKLNKLGKKVTGIIFTEDYEFLVMTNDSRMRLIDLNTYETKTKYKGHSSGKYHIQPSYNFEKELILSGSEDEKVYVWNKQSDYVPQLNPAYSIQKAHRNTSYEYFKPFPKANTTCAVWIPFPALQKYKEKMLTVWKDIYVDNLMLLFSSDAKVKVLGNLIELEDTVEKK